MLKRRFDKMLSEGLGSQLIWLLVVVLVSLLFFWGLASILFRGWDFSWQDIVALYLDGGNFAGKGEHDWFRLIVTLFGLLLFSTLLISVFNNLFDNIVDAVRTGRRRYSLKDHVLILGAGKELLPILENLRLKLPKQTDIAIMTSTDASRLKERLSLETGDSDFVSRIYFYQGERNVYQDLKSACAHRSSAIFIIGEDGEENHDSCNMESQKVISRLCEQEALKGDKKMPESIRCYVCLDSDTAIDVVQYDKAPVSTPRLLTDYIGSSDTAVEQLLVHSDFLPVLKEESSRYSHLVIIGCGEIADRVGIVAAHLSHYPRYKDGSLRKTLITFIGEGMWPWMNHLVSQKSNLFELCHYSYISAEGEMEHMEPDERYGDFMDLEWEFIDSDENSPMVRSYLSDCASSEEQALSIVVCYDSQSRNEDVLVHLPLALKDCKKGVFVQRRSEILLKAAACGMFGDVKLFGPGSDDYQNNFFPLRCRDGMKVNDVYEKAYGSGRDSRTAWYSICEAHKLSSIYCYEAIGLKQKCFDKDCDEVKLYECEHRRWMASVLLLGYRAMTPEEIAKTRAEGRVKEMKAQFKHVDIVPFEDLPKEEQDKDKVLLDALM